MINKEKVEKQLNLLFGVKKYNEEEAKENEKKLIEENYNWTQIKEINKRKYLNNKLKLLKYDFKRTLDYLEKVIEQYKELYQRTELWEGRTTYDYNFEDWNTIRKANGRLKRYYNELLKIRKEIF